MCSRGAFWVTPGSVVGQLSFVSRRRLSCINNSLNPLSDDKILKRSKLKPSAEGNFKFDGNGRKFSKRVENIVGKGEIARIEQFLLFPKFFQKAFFPGESKGVIMWEWVKHLLLNVSADLNQTWQEFFLGGHLK